MNTRALNGVGAVREVHEQLLAELDLQRAELTQLNEAQLRIRVQESVTRIVRESHCSGASDSQQLIRTILDEVLGLGPLEPLLADDEISEIMVNGPGSVFVEKAGSLQRVELAFSSERALRGIIERIVAPTGRRIDESSPMVDARLADGSRVNVILPPLALCGPVITIRKFANRRLGIEQLVANGSMSQGMARLLELAVAARRNIVVSGGTGSGKTTLLNAISALIDERERIVTIEDAAELQLRHDHVVALEARPRNLEGQGEVSIRDLVRNALRMRPDRIIVGECRGGEALDMLQAMNTGHAGSLTTAHANTPRDLLSRLEIMVLMAGMELPLPAVRAQVAGAIDLIVQQSRFADGSRRVTGIVEVVGMDSGTIQLQELFRYQRRGAGADGRERGEYQHCGQVPRFLERAVGVAPADLALFGASVEPLEAECAAS